MPPAPVQIVIGFLIGWLLMSMIKYKNDDD